MPNIADWMLLIVSTLISIKSYKSIIKNKNSSVSHFVILIEYIFLCVPILLNYIFGVPSYTYIPWYKPFISSMNNESIGLIYDAYIIISIIALFFYSVYYDKKRIPIENNFNGLINNKYFSLLLIFSPIFYILVSGNLMAYFVYASTAARGIYQSNFNVILSMLILFSIYGFCCFLFSKQLNKRSFIVLCIYTLIISWINGKRFIIALLLMVFLFFYTKSDINIKSRKKLEILVPFSFIGLIVFSYFYLIFIKPLSDVSFISVYDMLRVDFGRDDVIKFVIEQEFYNDNPILQYRGQTFLSTFFTFIPREIWAGKPYPHYMYLTSSILGIPIDRLPAGTTPSWFEMCIANFSWFGFVIGSFGIPILCYWCDRLKSLNNKMIFLVFIIVLITQSTDAYVGFLILFFLKLLMYSILGNKRIKIKFN